MRSVGVASALTARAVAECRAAIALLDSRDPAELATGARARTRRRRPRPPRRDAMPTAPSPCVSACVKSASTVEEDASSRSSCVIAR